ncbi:DegT/DnrJ/EryC1/StrS aminotransferase family protein [Campylobacter sp. RM13119]|uniref:DegT/DnrJ/EryC1/StrS family aminotransferase n=1 Tax=Campylobacter TaxID=194 RepID=UPI0014743DD9|nr:MULTISPECIES: DegT/DnrJ/EryC1/StrS aminotransferase family protein [unclassified Campylobacter]MBE3022302.1 DegT/DnrJ/EryC1/StrS aminotransferase family protein [Campylobacter sp. 7477a]MBE3605869.1 DegT/DnrJ/EryC1/StrS aminotransferase family protein [Campylobacter sp. RM13119]MBE3609986.1 DegT/DnrJ/EryC1/StrS aminotransferase family protein [Campylobacter sp. RM12916]
MEEISFYKPTITERENELIQDVLKNQNSNKTIKALEDTLQKYFGAKHVISTNNLAAAHHLALSAMEIKRGDKIICSVNSFPSVAQSIRHFDAEPIFVDINEDDFNINPDSLEKALKEYNHKKLKGIFVSHIAGQSAPVDEINEIAKHYDVKVLDDANRSIGLTYNGAKIGNENSFLSCFQTYSQVNNPIATAGFFTTNDDKIAERARLLRNYALINGIDKYGNLGYIYDVVDIGLKYDISALNAAYATAQIEKNDMFIKRRKEIAEIYNKELANCPHITTPIKKRDHVYSQYIIKIDKNRDSFARELLENDIHTSLHYIPIHLLSYYKAKYNLKVNAYPSALKVYQQVLSLPIYNALKDEEVYYICEKIKEISKSRV